jgi:hypothetical protein
MGQLFHKTHHHMNNWKCDNPHALGDQVYHSDPQKTRLGIVKRTGECFSSYGRDDLRAKIEPPSCRQYKPGDVLAVRPLDCDKIIDQNDDDENWADPGALSGGRSNPSDGNENDDGEGEELGKGTVQRMGRGNGRGRQWRK